MRLLTLEEYSDALIEDGQTPGVATDLKQRLYENGAMRVAWAAATGGRRGHLYKGWDVRMIETDTPGAVALKSVLGVDGETSPLGVSPIPELKGRAGVVQAFTMPAEPQKVILKNRRIRNRIQFHYNAIASAALALGNSAASIWVASDDAAEARSGCVRIADRMLANGVPQ